MLYRIMTSLPQPEKTDDIGASPYPPSGEITIQGEIQPLIKRDDYDYVVHARCPVFTHPQKKEKMTQSSRYRASAKSRRIGTVPPIWSNFYGHQFNVNQVRFVGVSHDGQPNGRDAKRFPESAGRLAVTMHGAVSMVVDERYLDNPTFGDYLYFEPQDSNFRIRGSENYGIPIIRNISPQELLKRSNTSYSNYDVPDDNFDSDVESFYADSEISNLQKKSSAPLPSAPLQVSSSKKTNQSPPPSPSAPPPDSSSTKTTKSPAPTPLVSQSSSSSTKTTDSPVPAPSAPPLYDKMDRRFEGRQTGQKSTRKQNSNLNLDLDTARILSVLAKMTDAEELPNNSDIYKIASAAWSNKKPWMFQALFPGFLTQYTENREQVVSEVTTILTANEKNILFREDKFIMNPHLFLPIDQSSYETVYSYCYLGNPQTNGLPFYIHKLLSENVDGLDNFVIDHRAPLYVRVQSDDEDKAWKIFERIKELQNTSEYSSKYENTFKKWERDQMNIGFFGLHGHTALQKQLYEVQIDTNNFNFTEKISIVEHFIDTFKQLGTSSNNIVSIGVGVNELHKATEVLCHVCENGPLRGKTPRGEAQAYNKTVNGSLDESQIDFMAKTFFTSIDKFDPESSMRLLQDALNGKHFYFDHPAIWFATNIKTDEAFQPADDTVIGQYYGLYTGARKIPNFNTYLRAIDERSTKGDISSETKSFFKTQGIEVAGLFDNAYNSGEASDSSVLPHQIIGVYLEHTRGENQVRLMLKNHGSLLFN